MCELQVDVRYDDDRTTLMVRGELDLASMPGLEHSAAQAEAERSSPCVTVDLTELDFIDSCGLNALTRMHRRLTRGGRTLTVIVPQGRIDRVFQYSGLKQCMDIQVSPTAPDRPSPYGDGPGDTPAPRPAQPSDDAADGRDS
ncbi:anti-anti-sigma factor [Nocardiopsis mwathae]|uniref:Anti-sigma factor antagonist n=2 Tax=Nocardiopsis mwathae TaxID=1472723 RepID=A0A7W9YEQ1_9ACTN|nr:anti-anti-sigma factor [Nocardiopsis mwathae]